jgi:hypothetical protein
MVIESAEEYVRLRESEVPAEYGRAADEAAGMDVWLDVSARFPDHRKWVAHNKTVPLEILEILEILATDRDPDIRWTVANKGKSTPAILDRLAWDPDEGVRLIVALHRKTSTETLRRLTEDTWAKISEEARRRLDPDQETGGR